MKSHKLDKTFGQKNVDENEREQLIRNVFNQVAPRYDLMNDAMSFGIHRLWKRKLVRMANPQAGQTIVDLATGTGDVAKKMHHSDCVVIAVDPSLAMMQAGVDSAYALTYVVSAGETLSFADNSVDTLTIAFGVRNMTQMKLGLAEIYRVLKPGGRLLCLEFSEPVVWLRPFYNLYSYYVIPRLGSAIASNTQAYTYLIDSIRQFPSQLEMVELLEELGFSEVSYSNVSFGIACIHSAYKRVRV